MGAKIEEDISQSNIIFGIKEVEISKLIKNKTYLFFSHTSKIRNDSNQSTQDSAIIYKKTLLREGDELTFEVENGDKGPSAVKLQKA